MKFDDDLRVRPGRIRGGRTGAAKPFLNQALRAAAKAGGLHRTNAKRGGFGRGRAASLAAGRLLGDRSRGAVVKARIVRRMRTPGALGAHLRYLERDGVTKDGAPGRVFDAAGEDADARAFVERCDGDRHHFRFIVSPDYAHELADLRAFTRELVDHAASDLGTRLDWVAVDHWNTEHPHIHLLVRGRTDRGDDLVISRDYIAQGLRARAAELVTLELGPRTDLEVRRGLDAQVEADRWTKLDRALAREADLDGGIDLRRDPLAFPDPLREIKISRMRKLERLGLAEPDGTGRWTMHPDAEPRLRALGERDDIIKRLHRSMGADRGADFVLEGERRAEPVIGRLAGRGLDDELKGSAYAIVDGIDGRAHHLRLPSLEATGDAGRGAIIELRRFADATGKERLALAVRSDLDLASQIGADGATWLDRQLVARTPVPLAEGGFGAEVRDALAARAERLIEQGLAKRDAGRFVPVRDLLGRLRGRELDAAARRIADETGLAYRPSAVGEYVTGSYRQRLSLASGRFAMLDDGVGFQLVPWTPSLERHLGKSISGVAMPDGGIDWSFARHRDLGL